MKTPVRSAYRSVAAFTVLLWLTPGAFAAALYVNVDNPTPAAPFTNWANAAAVIQDAVDAAAPGDEVVVTNGVYQTGARAVYGTSNRVAVTKPVTVRSVNGPAYTSIVGFGPIGDNAIRCAYLTNGAMLAGFTLTNGATRTSGDLDRESSGGGAWCEASGVLSNCVLTGNSSYYGGGAYSGTLNHCTLSGNSATYGGGSYYGTLNHCTLTGNSAVDDGGGSYGSTFNDCTLTGNTASVYGGGSSYGTLKNCMLTGNSAEHGGGSYEDTLSNCTLTGNSASQSGGGAYDGTLDNSVVYYNTAPDGPNYSGNTIVLNYCCTTPLPSHDPGNISAEPLFVDTNGWSNLRLQSNSPCINAGNNAYVTATDLDGNPRIVNGTVDIGAYEWQVPARFAPLARPGLGGLSLSVSGETNRAYAVHASSNLVTWFWLGQFTNSPGQPALIDPLSPLPHARFYRATPVP